MNSSKIGDLDTRHVGNRTRWLLRFGLAASLFYIFAMAAYAAIEKTAFLQMKPEEFATFLSGVFAPLAFLWLVLGFMQQGDELRNSANALWLQGEELRNSVEQQRQLVEVTREQLAAEYAARMREEEEAERNAQPRLLMPSGGGSYSGPRRSLTFSVISAGPNCSDVEVYANEQFRGRKSFFPEGDRLDLQFVFETPDAVQSQAITIKYTDIRGNRRRQKFDIPVDVSGGPNGDRTLGVSTKVDGVERDE